MTTLAETIQAALNPLTAGGSWFMLNTTEPPVYPYIVWFNAASSTNNSLQGASDLQNTRVQVDIFHQSSIAGAASQLTTIAAAVSAAIAASGLTAVQLSSSDMSVPELRAYRRVMEFSIWFKG